MTSKQAVLKLYKNRGETPLECIERFKKDNPKYKDEKMTYAGRLDPLAEGLLLVLIGEECKNKDKYLGMDKEYEVDILFGFSTDTYDVLGVIKSKVESCKVVIRNEFQNILQSFVGKFSQKYPAYSSKNIKKILNERKEKKGSLSLRMSEVKGKGESPVLSDVEEEFSVKDVEIKNIEFLGQRTISKQDLEKFVIDSVNLVKGDFRQNEVLELWNSVFASEAKQPTLYQIISIRVTCTSGTYMRSLANSIGEKVGISALALNIKRTRLGKYKVEI